LRELWIRIDPSLKQDKKKSLINFSKEYCVAFVIDSEDKSLARIVGTNKIVSSREGDILLVDNMNDLIRYRKNGIPTCFVKTVVSKEDEEEVVKATGIPSDYIAIKCPDWKVIPLENIIAKTQGRSKLFVWVDNSQEAKVALETLEIGVDGIILDSKDPKSIEQTHQMMMKVKTRAEEKENAERISLIPARIVELNPIGSGSRVCVDTCDLMRIGEGMLVGCHSSGLFLIQAEVIESSFVASRPFRVNAGPPALYVAVPDGKTRYLSELKAGEEVLIVDRHGKPRTTNICRIKIEYRPLFLIEAESTNRKIKTVVQNAETVRIVTKEGHKSISDLNLGDEVLVHIQEGGRHFGTLVKEEWVIER
jgi:3-dehydroquinate synthase II